MSTQIFKQIVPIECLFNLLDAICIKTETHYVLNSVSYKKGVYSELISDFMETCKPYYHKSKQGYLDLPSKYKSFVTIVRQICNSHNITYTSSIQYDKSKYDIVYLIMLN